MFTRFFRRVLAWRGPRLIRIRLRGGPLDGLEQSIPRDQIRGGVWYVSRNEHTIHRYLFETPPETEFEGDQPVTVWHGRHAGYGLRVDD